MVLLILCKTRQFVFVTRPNIDRDFPVEIVDKLEITVNHTVVNGHRNIKTFSTFYCYIYKMCRRKIKSDELSNMKLQIG